MMRHVFLVMMLALSVVSPVGAVEVKLPFDAESLAAQARRKCPDSVNVSGNKDVLTVSISEAGKGGYDGQYSINVKKGAGHSVDVTVGVKTENISLGGRDASRNIGRIAFGNVSRAIAGDKSDWQTYTFKNVKIPSNGMVKLRLTLRNVHGDISIRDPRVNVNLSKRAAKKKKNSKKK